MLVESSRATFTYLNVNMKLQSAVSFTPKAFYTLLFPMFFLKLSSCLETKIIAEIIFSFAIKSVYLLKKIYIHFNNYDCDLLTEIKAA